MPRFLRLLWRDTWQRQPEQGAGARTSRMPHLNALKFGQSAPYGLGSFDLLLLLDQKISPVGKTHFGLNSKTHPR